LEFTGMMTKHFVIFGVLLAALTFSILMLIHEITTLAEPVHIGDTVIIRFFGVNDGLKTCRSVVGVSPSGKYIQVNNCDYTLDRDDVLEVVEHKSCGYEPRK
jgi:hypothetical protein